MKSINIYAIFGLIRLKHTLQNGLFTFKIFGNVAENFSDWNTFGTDRGNENVFFSLSCTKNVGKNRQKKREETDCIFCIHYSLRLNTLWVKKKRRNGLLWNPLIHWTMANEWREKVWGAICHSFDGFYCTDPYNRPSGIWSINNIMVKNYFHMNILMNNFAFAICSVFFFFHLRETSSKRSFFFVSSKHKSTQKIK